METYLKSALYRYEHRPNAHFTMLLRGQITKTAQQGFLTLEDAQEIMAVAAKVDPQERDTYPAVRATILKFFPLDTEN